MFFELTSYYDYYLHSHTLVLCVLVHPLRTVIGTKDEMQCVWILVGTFNVCFDLVFDACHSLCVCVCVNLLYDRVCDALRTASEPTRIGCLYLKFDVWYASRIKNDKKV